jgi:hypothetical protein
MTVKWSSYAQSLTKKPMKGMLTGPVTILNWSFPRADISREMQSKQLALALRDEVIDLEKAGIHAIQVDEPAIREGVSRFTLRLRNSAVLMFRSFLSAELTGMRISSGLLTPLNLQRPVSPINSRPTLTFATLTLTISSRQFNVSMPMLSRSRILRVT